MEITENEFWEKIDLHTSLFEDERQLTAEELLMAGYLWNTVVYNDRLMQSTPGKHFYDLVVEKGIPEMIKILKMETGRGYTFHSTEFHFVLGGIMEPQYRFEIKQ